MATYSEDFAAALRAVRSVRSVPAGDAEPACRLDDDGSKPRRLGARQIAPDFVQESPQSRSAQTQSRSRHL